MESHRFGNLKGRAQQQHSLQPGGNPNIQGRVKESVPSAVSSGPQEEQCTPAPFCSHTSKASEPQTYTSHDPHCDPGGHYFG